MTPPPSKKPDSAYSEVLGRDQPSYTPVEPFVQKDLKKKIAPKPAPKDTRAALADQKQKTGDTTGTMTSAPRQSPAPAPTQ